MEKIINVGGRLHNPVVGGALTGADEIKDDLKGKMQNVINQETDAELVRLDEAKQEKLTFDQTPTENSTNPVTSGGVYAADAALQQAIEAILLLIPSAASALNQLADKSFVNSSIATATATFRGTYNLVTDLELTVSATHQQIATALASVVSTADNNDYCFVQIPVSDQSTDIRVTERYKFDGTSWEYEYDLNNSGFTADQWGAINSGITSVLVGKLGGLPTAQELATMFAGKQNTLTFDNTPVAGSDNPVKSSGLYNAFAAINALIPEGADANNKLVAESRLVAYVTTLINALDATFDVTSADGHVTLRMTQADGVITSVQILTSDIASASALATLGGRVSTAESDIDALQDAYAALTQSDVVIVEGALPSSGQQQNIIYRQLDQEHTPPQFYSDYMWNGTTWVLMATYMNGIDPRPKKGSQNLVTSGGVFDNMGALDVSELNATENPHTLATYADLSAALAAIPSDYQKGGMSIKFVQSSDNKYVQFRYMGTAITGSPNPFLDTANWQGVDDEPTFKSNNLVKSGGVDKALNKYIYSPLTVIQSIGHSAIGLSGDISNVASDYSDTIKIFSCLNLNKVNIEGYYIGYDRLVWAFYNSANLSSSTLVQAGDNIRNTDLYNPTHVDSTIDVPNGATHIALTVYTGDMHDESKNPISANSIEVISILDRIEQVSEDVEQVSGEVNNIKEELITDKDVAIDYEDEYIGSALRGSGAISSEAADRSMHIDTYACAEGDKFHIVGNWVGYDRYIYNLYNSTEISASTLVSNGSRYDNTSIANPTPVDELVTIPAGVSCIAVGSYHNDAMPGESIRCYKVEKVNRLDALEEDVEELKESAGEASKIFDVTHVDGSIVVTRKYASTNGTTLGVRISKVGPSSLMQLSGITYNNGSTYVGTGSDWIGPYNMTADNNGNGNSGFTGGWHGYNGDQTGSATARTASYSLELDNAIVSEFGTYKADRVKIKVTNYIQAGNTKEQDGSGREVLKEIVVYEFVGNKLYVSVESTALEALHIKTYYGMQINGYSSKYQFVGRTCVYAPSDGTTRYNNNVETRIIVGTTNDQRKVSAALDNLDLGTFRNIAENGITAFCSGYGSSGYSKAYYNLIKSETSPAQPEEAMSENSCIFWSGNYEFFE